VLKFGVKTPVNKNNSSSLILTNLKFKFEACLIFINFGVKKFTLKNTQKKKNFDV
jgi:hypothetical protein